jgi:hypothetical protein
MNVKKWLLSSLIVFILYWILQFIVHSVILMGYYEATASHWLTEAQMQSRMWAMILGMLLFVMLLCYIYTKGIREGGLGDGVRFGFWIGLFLAVPMYFIRWSTEALPGMLIFLDALLMFIVLIILGGVLGIVYGKVAKT